MLISEITCEETHLDDDPKAGQSGSAELGWTEPDELEQIAASWRAWSEDPGAFYAKPCGEAVGWKQ